MARYLLHRVCNNCGFLHIEHHEVYGDFDGFSPHRHVMTSKECPWCKHAKKLKIFRGVMQLVKEKGVHDG